MEAKGDMDIHSLDERFGEQGLRKKIRTEGEAMSCSLLPSKYKYRKRQWDYFDARNSSTGYLC